MHATKSAPNLSLVEAATRQYESAASAAAQQSPASVFRQRAQERLQLLQNSGLYTAHTAPDVDGSAPLPPAPVRADHPGAGPAPLATRRTLPIHLAWGTVCALLSAALIWQVAAFWPSAGATAPRADQALAAAGGASLAPAETASAQLRLSTQLSRPIGQR